jgi:hypothetical protein
VTPADLAPDRPQEEPDRHQHEAHGRCLP